MNKIYRLLWSIFTITIMLGSNAYTQTVRGKVIDQDAKTPLIGANVIIAGSEPIKGAASGPDGNFKIENVDVGRITLQVSCLGYEKKMIPNILVGTGKEVILTIELIESLIQLNDIEIKAKPHKSKALNEMAMVSAKVFTVEETQRYAGAFNDPARMVSAYAGVTGDATGSNDIVVRGNSSKGILWRLDGVEIPNPNHFADEGATGGPINALNSSMLANSDFFSGAFAPEYGNAYSGVFDMRLRSGNNEKPEYSFSMGVLGVDLTAEGPFKKEYSGSFLANYRYSSLNILDKLNIVDFEGVPKYQDASFKVVLPTKKTGTFFLYGLGGISNIYQEEKDEEGEEYVYGISDFGADLGFVGLNHVFQINDKTYIKNSLSVSGTRNDNVYHKRMDDGNWFMAYRDNYVNTSVRFSTYVNTKLSTRHRIKEGITYANLGYDLFAETKYLADGDYITELNARGRAGMVQAFINWKYRVRDNFTLISGVHYLHFLLNNSSSIEPRLGMEWRFSSNQAISLGAGIHSKLESIATYYAVIPNDDGTYTTPNKNLELAKAAHYVLGYANRFAKNWNVKMELYYQQLFNLAVEDVPGSRFVLNHMQSGFVNRNLVNKGKGRNYGAELTLERFFSDHYYVLLTGSLYESKLTAIDGVERDSRYNGNYAGNILFGREVRLGNAAKNRTLGINTKILLIGGHRYTPLDLDASIQEGKSVYQEDMLFALKADDIFSVNLALSYRKNRKKATHEFKIDIQNVTNNQAMVFEYYNDYKKDILKAYQLAILPNIIYTIQF